MITRLTLDLYKMAMGIAAPPTSPMSTPGLAPQAKAPTAPAAMSSPGTKAKAPMPSGGSGMPSGSGMDPAKPLA